ncbi:NRPS condensation-like uncharacterized protein [Streptacidiphilus sp. MAP12-33]|uniref:phthiocerol/phthiodiolone dimycocerosyl transferase family protein n=1 Tax=Streptacidiphilus sp. MAP12-33 TaxID=3156266 RepID=UPI003516C1AB
MSADPTRFTAVDETADLMERRGEPNLIYLELAVTGRFDVDRLRAAVRTAFAAHPATRSHRAPTPPWRTRSRWQLTAWPATDPLTVRTGPSLDSLDSLDLAAERRAILDTPLDLRDAPLLRLRLLTGAPGGDRLLLVAHHAGFDGMGFVGVLLAICAAYNATPQPPCAAPAPSGTPHAVPAAPGRVSGGPAHPWAPVPGAALPLPLPVAASGGAPRAVPAALGPASGAAGVPKGPGPGAGRPVLPVEAVRRPRPGLLPVRPVRVAREPAGGGRSGYAVVPLAFDAERTAALSRAARAAGVTLNDLLLAALALAVVRWNAAHARPTAPLRITMPVNTRDGQTRHDGQGNHSRLTSIGIGADSCAGDPRTLLAAVAARTAEAKAAPAGPQGGPAAVVLGAAWLPRAIRQLLAPGVRFAARALADTTMLSNLGPITALPRSLAGAGDITELWAAAPAPMPRGLSVTALGAGGRLHLMIRHRLEALDASAAAAFTELLAHAVTELSTGAPAPSPALAVPRSPEGPS